MNPDLFPALTGLLHTLPVAILAGVVFILLLTIGRLVLADVARAVTGRDRP